LKGKKKEDEEEEEWAMQSEEEEKTVELKKVPVMEDEPRIEEE
jgi:hypothetical protein